MKLRFAVPTEKGKLAPNIHRCCEIALVDVDDGVVEQTRTVEIAVENVLMLVRSLHDVGVHVVIAGGVRRDILDALNRSDINLVTGVVGKSPRELVEDFLNNTLDIQFPYCEKYMEA